MRNVILYIATSVDGYVADENGSVSFIKGDSDIIDIEGYEKFYHSIDTVILGRTTYEQIINELAETWPYEEKISYVITSKEYEDKINIKFKNNVIDLIKELKKQDGKDIWICGGASVANQLLKENLIDKIRLTIVPVILGGGIKLFDTSYNSKRLKLIESSNFNGFVEMIYVVKEN